MPCYRGKDHEKYLEYRRQKYWENREIILATKKRYRLSNGGKATIKAYLLSYRENKGEKIKAKSQVLIHLRNGKLVRESCEICDAKIVDAHHEDYSKPLEVKWLCKKHHAERHREIRVKQVS